ncbi:MAG TPA: amidohydrolase family protein [Thermoanaerobaculia bacterium]|nr:amidohydrolase family protein [Thermoanaerobaculia bacterium]
MTRFFRAATLSVAALFLLAGAAPSGDDLVFTGGRVVDGTGKAAFRGDVAVRDGRISAVGDLAPDRIARARRRIDATGLVVAPGFIDLLGQSEYNALVDRRAASKITQGITSEVTGEGESIAPLGEALLKSNEDSYRHYGLRPDWSSLLTYFMRLRRTPPTINLGTFVGLGGLRRTVVGTEDRRAGPAELDRMKALVAQAMEDGALGVSTSLQYVPDLYNSTDEIIACARVAASRGGVYFTHQRSEGNRIDSSLAEVFRIAREARIPTNVWHLKAAYRRNWGAMPRILAAFKAARASGLDVAANQYPWNAGSNGLDACLPPWVRAGGRERLLARLRDPEARARIRNEMAEDADSWENQWFGSGGGSGVMLAAVLNPELKKYEGGTLQEIGALMKKDPRDALMDIVLADRANAQCIIFMMSEDDVRAALKDPFVGFCTDSGAAATDGIYSEERSHPRAWASTARLLATYVRDEKVLPLEEAVRKMTSFSAARAGLRDRGVLKAGLAGDVVAFDPVRVRAVSTYADPLHYSEGFPYVAVNGALVVDGGKITAARPGRPLLGLGTAATR